MAGIKGYTLRVIRNGEVKLTLPAHMCAIKTDGTVWCGNNPILGISDPAAKAQAAKDVTARRFDRIPADAWCRMGDNANGVTLMDDEMWASSTLKAEADAEATRKRELEARTVRVYISSRGWGDYSPVEWVGDITRPDSEIIRECYDRLAMAEDVDNMAIMPEEMISKIHAAREKWAGREVREAEYQADIQRKIDSGFCFACETWCEGDCGHYSNDPWIKYRRDLRQATAEANYGINEG